MSNKKYREYVEFPWRQPFMNNTQKIRRVSLLLRSGCDAYLILKPLLALVIWLNLEEMAGDLSSQFSQPLRWEFIGPMNLLAGFLVSCIPIALMMYGVWRLRLLFGQYRVGSFFTLENASHLHAFAKMLLITVILSPVIDVLLSVAMTINYPQGERSISIDFSSNDLSTLFVAGVMFAVGWTMRESYRLATENAEFV